LLTIFFYLPTAANIQTSVTKSNDKIYPCETISILLKFTEGINNRIQIGIKRRRKEKIPYTNLLTP